MSGDAIGMMEGAFFVSKGVILEWMNELLDVSKPEPYSLLKKQPLADLIPFCFSFNCRKLSSARPELFTAR